MRKWVFVFFGLNFLLTCISIYPNFLEDAYLFLMSIALVLLGYWIWKDGDQIKWLRKQVSQLIRESEDETARMHAEIYAEH